MPNSVACKHCGTLVPFEAYERGSTVYCPSCGRANLAPAAPASSPAAVERTAAKVFSPDGTIEIQPRLVGEETCLCGEKIPVRVADYGSSVYCPSCGTAVQVGESLDRPKYRQAREEKAEAAPPQSLPRPSPALRLIRSPLSIAALILMLISAAFGVWMTWRHPNSVENFFAGWLPVTRDETPNESTSPRSNRPGASQGGSLSSDRVPMITAARIEQLRKASDPKAALVRARFWEQTLRDHGTPEDDTRYALLADVIAGLAERLVPKGQAPPSRADEIRGLLRRADDAIASGDLAAARKALAEAAELLEADPEPIGGFLRRLQSLQERLGREERLVKEVDRIRRLLGQADETLAAGQVTAALESEASARFLALVTAVTQAEAAELRQKTRAMGHEFRFAIARRAVHDARQCDRAGDVPGRDREARRALALLPGLKESRIKPYLDEIRTWIDGPAEGTPAAEQPEAAVPATSEVARKIDVRDRYEALLELYANDDLAALLPAALDADKRLQRDDAEAKTLHRKIGDLAFDLLEHRYNRQEAASVPATRRLRELLGRLEPWKDAPRWKTLAESLR